MSDMKKYQDNYHKDYSIEAELARIRDTIAKENGYKDFKDWTDKVLKSKEAIKEEPQENWDEIFQELDDERYTISTSHLHHLKTWLKENFDSPKRKK